MKKTRIHILLLVAVFFSATVLLSSVLMAEKGGAPKTGSDGDVLSKKDNSAVKNKISKQCPMGKKRSKKKFMKKIKLVLEQVAVAKKAVKADDKKAALAALTKIEATMKSLQSMAKGCKKGKAPNPAIRPAVVNKTCPIMGLKIDPNKVPDNLYRQFKGKGVGFCCGGCPGPWDKLSDSEKQAKLTKATK